jgi:hypothetical protein
MAGAATGGFLSLRSGLRPAFRSAVVGGLLLVRGAAGSPNGGAGIAAVGDQGEGTKGCLL